ncbi:hypothetical protein GCM10010433_22040 [Streptomyces pulveraceus]
MEHHDVARTEAEGGQVPGEPTAGHRAAGAFEQCTFIHGREPIRSGRAGAVGPSGAAKPPGSPTPAGRRALQRAPRISGGREVRGQVIGAYSVSELARTTANRGDWFCGIVR